MTTAKTTWTETKDVVGNVWYWSPNFAPAVQEVLARAGWVSGNHLGVLCVSTAAAGTEIQALTYESAPASAIVLYVSYVGRAGGAML